MLLVGVVFLIAVSGAAYGVLSTSFKSATTMSRAISNAEIMKGVMSAIAAASSSDSDGILLPPAGLLFKPGLSGTETPSGGWEIPATLTARKYDVYGANFGYCAWNHGSSNSGSGYFNGQSTATGSQIAFALISAGPDKIFQTTCTQAKTGSALGDDTVQTMALGSLAQANNGGLIWVDPVDCFDAATPATDLIGIAAGCATSSSRVDLVSTTNLASGALVLARKSGQLYSWYGGSWSAVSARSGGYNGEGFLANNFTSINGAVTSTVYESNTVRVVGIGNAVLVTISNGSFAISTDGVSWGAWQTGADSISNGQYLKLRQTSSPSSATTTTATVNVGATSKTWNLSTS